MLLTLTSKDETSTPTTPATTPSTIPKNLAKTSDVDTAKTLSVVGIIVGAIGLVVALGAFALGRRPRAT